MNFARLLSATLLATLPLLAHSLPGPQLAPATVISPADANINGIFTASIARASDGRSVVAWAEEGFIYLQRVNADGTLNGMRINGNALGTGTVRDLQVAMDRASETQGPVRDLENLMTRRAARLVRDRLYYI